MMTGSIATEATPLLRFNGPEVSPAAIVQGLLRVCFPDALTVLDLTIGAGCFWRGAAVFVTASTADFRHLDIADQTYDVAAIDPPHLGDLGANSVMRKRYGTYVAADLEQVFRQGCREAMRVARLGVIVKVTDHVHGQKFVCETAWVLEELGTPFEMVHGQHDPLVFPGWQDPPLSARNNGSTYLAFRRGTQRHVRRSPSKVAV
ncbi:MAG TPA: hypothetical protein VKV73_14285 [Chloroflexota bacterium]|nr:hypothetical protein [Chloroflexota bacterium]